MLLLFISYQLSEAFMLIMFAVTRITKELGTLHELTSVRAFYYF